MKNFHRVILINGTGDKVSITSEVKTGSDVKARTDLIRLLIKEEIGDPPGLDYGDSFIEFSLPPDGKYKTFEEFEKWLSGKLKNMEYKPCPGLDYCYFREF